MPQPDDASAQPPLGAPAGLCGDCVHALINVTRRGTAYLRCGRAGWDDRLARYPRLPVRECVGYQSGESRESR